MEKTPYRIRKERRTANYWKYVHGWKQRSCTACAGSGYYDDTDRHGRTPKCGSCNGTGKETYRGPKSGLLPASVA